MRSSRVVRVSETNAVVATVLGSIQASSGTVKSGGRQMKQCWISYIKKEKIHKNPLFYWWKTLGSGLLQNFLYPRAKNELAIIAIATFCLSILQAFQLLVRPFLLPVIGVRVLQPNTVQYYVTSGFLPRVRARALRAPVFLGSLPHLTGRCAPPPRPSQLRYSLKNKKTFQKQNASLLGRTRAARGRAYTYLSTGLSCTHMSYIAPYWATMHPPELRCTLLSYAAPY